MSRTTQRRSSVRPPWGTWGGVCQKSPAFTGCSTPSWIRIHSPSRHTPHCSFGCECTGVTLVPSLAAAASPAGRVTADFYEATTRRLLDDLRGAGRLDGVLLDLHGAMVPEGLEDGEGDLLRAVRATVGSAVPVAATLDFHANVTAEMVRHTTLLHVYKTYPHVDMDARGREATERLRDEIGRAHV